ncbi:DNA -binding domain-containing protein [Caulobacter sp. LARHSG274]
MAAPHATTGSDRPPRDSSGGGWRAFLGFTTPGLCWEFLRRNPAYREHFGDLARGMDVLDHRWGLSVPADPDLSADGARVVWRADVAPGLVVAMERRAFGRPKALPPTMLEPVVGEDGLHIRFPSGLQVQLRGEATPAGPLVVVLAYDADFNLRVRAVDALRRAALTDEPPRSRLSAEQKARLARSLFALDAAQESQSYREIAAGLFGEDEIDASGFKTSSLRDVTIRLVRRGRSLMAGGYLKLLKAGF